jgi:hypothetical protein
MEFDVMFEARAEFDKIISFDNLKESIAQDYWISAFSPSLSSSQDQTTGFVFFHSQGVGDTYSIGSFTKT